MHCPESVDGNTYVELVAAVSIAIAQNLDAKSTFILAEFAQSVSNQLITLAIFKEAEDHRRAERARKEKEAMKEAEANKKKEKEKEKEKAK